MKKLLLKTLVVLAGFTIPYFAQGQSCPKWGPYIGAKEMPGDAELMMADVMTPANANTSYTYTCAIQFGIGKSGGYCGLQNTNGDGGTKPLNNIFSV